MATKQADKTTKQLAQEINAQARLAERREQRKAQAK